MGLAGHPTSSTTYLMGNHTIAVRMLRIDPTVMIYAPLRTLICTGSGGNALFVVDQPSTQSDSFGSDEIAEIGRELDRKLAVLLAHLDAPVPLALRPAVP
jgi:hypothetical protein